MNIAEIEKTEWGWNNIPQAIEEVKKLLKERIQLIPLANIESLTKSLLKEVLGNKAMSLRLDIEEIEKEVDEIETMLEELT